MLQYSGWCWSDFFFSFVIFLLFYSFLCLVMLCPSPGHCGVHARKMFYHLLMPPVCTRFPKDNAIGARLLDRWICFVSCCCCCYCSFCSSSLFLLLPPPSSPIPFLPFFLLLPVLEIEPGSPHRLDLFCFFLQCIKWRALVWITSGEKSAILHLALLCI